MKDKKMSYILIPFFLVEKLGKQGRLLLLTFIIAFLWRFSVKQLITLNIKEISQKIQIVSIF